MANSLMCAGSCQQNNSMAAFGRQAEVTDEPAFYFCFSRSSHATKGIALQSLKNPKIFLGDI